MSKPKISKEAMSQLRIVAERYSSKYGKYGRLAHGANIANETLELVLATFEVVDFEETPRYICTKCGWAGIDPLTIGSLFPCCRKCDYMVLKMAGRPCDHTPLLFVAGECEPDEGREVICRTEPKGEDTYPVNTWEESVPFDYDERLEWIHTLKQGRSMRWFYAPPTGDEK